MLHGPLATEAPASFLQLHPDVTVMLDGAASGR
jgi:6-phosphogluconolactonase/glucosamine-6-phosphate isomerase/deaminase